MWLAANVVQQHFPLAWLMSPEATLFELFKRIDVKKATQPNLQQTSFNKKPSDSREAIQRSFSLSNHQPVPTKPINEQLVTTTPKDSKPNDNKPFVPKQKTGKPEPVDYTTKASNANLINTEVRKSRHTGDHPKHFNENQTVHPNERTVSNTDGSPVLSSDVQNSPLEPLTFEHEFSTHYAGTFYLLNLLNRPDAQNILKTHWQHADHGLLWLHQLATRLGLPKQDPINHYIANELNYDHSELIAIEELQGLNGIVTLGQQWYGKQGLWQPTLLELPATIEADESHIDMTVADSLINIDIRVMGLDINPGWLPWLGKVVSFHYIPGGRTK
jgi:hypothetical protein